MANQVPDANATGGRRLKYGSNLVLLLVIAIVIIGLLAYLTTRPRLNRRFDWSTGGLYTLSQQTKNLLQEFDTKKQAVDIIDNFRPETATSTTELTQDQQVLDLLDQYTRQSTNIKLTEPKTREELENKIRERYTGETKPYQQVVKDFEPLANDLTKFFQAQATGFDNLAHTKGVADEDAREVQGIANAFRKEFPALIKKANQGIRRNVDSTMPQWSRAKTQIADVLTIIVEQLKQVAAANASPDAFGKGIQEYLKKAAPEYAAMLKQVQAYKDRIDKLPALKIDDVLESIGPNTLIVIGPDNVKVISSSDVFQPDTRNAADPSNPKMVFQGEQAISTALMAMVRPNKPKIVFISSAPAQLLSGPFSDINDRLSKANFDVSEWAPPGMPRPDQPPPPETPPASGKDSAGVPIVWVVLPPDPPNMQQMQMGMPPPDPRPVIEAIRKHMDAGGNVMFLAEGASPMAMMGGGGGGFPYAELIKPFGIDVKANYYVLHQRRINEETTRAEPEIMFDTFPNHPITQPIQSLSTLFVGSPSQMGIMGCPTVVDVVKPAPTGADAAVIVQTPASADVFATSNTMTPNPQFDPKTDLKAPVPMGVAATRSNGQKCVVLGNKLFLVNQLLEAQAMDVQSGRVFYQLPGNAELMINCVSWLAGQTNMIAVSPNANMPERIASMSGTEAMAVRVGGWLLPPFLAIIVGTMIFFVRRRA